MSRKVGVFDRFDGGEFGKLGPHRAPPGSFTATNMMVYRDGSIGPRTGVKLTTPSGVPAGTVWLFGATAVPGSDGLIVIGDGVYSFSLGTAGSPLTLRGNLSGFAVTTPVARADNSNKVYLSVYAGRTYVYDPAAGTVAELGSGVAPGGRAAAVFGDRLAVANTTSGGNRIHYSAAGDFTSWPAPNYFDVGSEWQIGGLYNQRSHLVATKQNAWHVVTGNLGVDHAVRRIARQDGPLRAEAVLGKDDLLWCQAIFDRCPSIFDGAATRRLVHLEYSPFAGGAAPTAGSAIGIAAAATPAAGNAQTGVVFVRGTAGGGRWAVLHNGVWTFHTAGVSTEGFLGISNGQIHFCDGGSPAQVYSWVHDYDRPGDGVGNASQGDNSSVAVAASMSLPAWRSPTGAEVQARRVVVDVEKFAIGGGNSNHFELTVTAQRRTGGGAPIASAVQTFDEASAASNGVVSLVFDLGDQGRGAGLQVSLANVRGVGIHRIAVEYDEIPMRG